MLGFIIKLFMCPIAVLIASAIFPNVNYANMLQPILVGLVLAVTAHMMEVLVLKNGTFWTSTLIDFVAAAFIVYIVSFFFRTSYVTIGGALLTAVLLTIIEMAQHRWLIKSRRTEKSPA